MKNKVLKIMFIPFMVIGMLMLFNITCKAASFGAQISSTNVTVGETFTVTITANNAAGMYSISSNNSNVSITSGSSSEFIENSSTTITFKANSVGTANITATATDMTDLDDDTKTVTGSKTFTVTIKEKEEKNTNTPSETPKTEETPSTPTATTKSSNNKLKMLGITPNDFNNFKSGTTTYYVTVPNSVSEVNVYAEKQESSQKISGTGKVSLNEGSNTVRVVCTAEDGTTRTYTMYITRESADGNTVTEEQTQQEETTDEENTEEETTQTNEEVLGITKLNVTGKTETGESLALELAPDFAELVSEYQLTVPLTIKDIDITAEVENGTANVELIGNKDLKEGNNEVTVIVTVGEQKKVYQINVTKTSEATTKLSNEVILQLAIISAIATIIVAIIVVIIMTIVRNKRKKKEKYSKVDVEVGDMSKLQVEDESEQPENKSDEEK